jgi:hypothetical protein
MRGGTDGCCDLRRERAIARVRRTCDACAPLSHLRGPSRRAVGQNYRGDRDLDSLKRFVASLAKPPTKQRIMALDMLANELYRAENNTQQQQQLLDRMRSAADNFGCVSRDRSSLVFSGGYDRAPARWPQTPEKPRGGSSSETRATAAAVCVLRPAYTGARSFIRAAG